jgi:CubicO group peptidase (beta-lactamase class C family)
MESGVKKILNGTFPHIHSLLVAQGEKLLVDETFYGYSAQDPQPVQSITKSVFSILFGITQDRHLLQTGLKLYDYFPEYRSQKAWDSRKNQITLGNLLTMSSGFDCSDWKDAQACSWGMVNSNDWLDFVLSKPLAGDPGSHFSYCGACLLPLSVILERAGQKTIPQFAQQYLFDPLEIHSTRWVEAPSAGTKVVPVSFGLSISPRDLAKIGLLVLKQGEWEGQRIVSEDWIKESTSLKVPRGQTNHKYDYGYLWWETEFKIGNRNIRTVMGWGVGGNYLLIVPEKNLVFVITAGNTNDPQAAKCSLRLFQDYVLPAFFPLAQDKRNLG